MQTKMSLGRPWVAAGPLVVAGVAGLCWAEPVMERDRLTGDWGGVRDKMELGHGLSIGGEYLLEYSRVLDGGVNRRGAFRNLLTLDFELDLGTAAGLEGASVFAQYLSVNAERGGSVDAGDIQGYTNIENDRSLDMIAELWYQQTLFDDRLRIKVGKVDANSEFAAVAVAEDFASSSAGFSPTILGFPSYPDPAMSINLFTTLVVEDGYDLTLGYGFYDGAGGPDGVPVGSRGPTTFFDSDKSGDYFHVAELALEWDSLAVLHHGRVALGGWWHTGRFDRFDGGTERGTGGLFVTAEQRIYAPDADADGRGVYLFAQYGWADPNVSDFMHHFAGGAVVRGLVAGRPGDSAGVYVSFVDLSDKPGAGFSKDEWVIDAYYRVQLTPAVFLQPQVQYIINPSGDPTIDDALVGGIRLGVTF